ncbi:MAG: NUDIX domain-containing protein [Endomicrobium sp.]|jgi:8-oxo-dGTP pyrophosphatase MutT (NUDIX family)|nr:NUDIX domain-containing protein [Endomicrobium sp.]
MRNCEPVFLLVNSKRSRLWGFPKGHVEKGESEFETATREIFEETGINKVKFIENFIQEDIHVIKNPLSSLKAVELKNILYVFLLLH